ncbi:MAG: hypothetical protein ACRETQ_02645 [Gammaproteobacteria bacterium]
MNRKSMLLVTLVVLISGCATLSESRSINVHPPSANGSQWVISAKAETGNWDDKVTLFVNGTQAGQGILAPAYHHDVQVAGSYGQHIVIGICSRSDGAPVTYECHVYVDGSSVGTLTWLADG